MAGTPIAAIAGNSTNRAFRLSSGKPASSLMPNRALSLSTSPPEFPQAPQISSGILPEQLQAYYHRLFDAFGPQRWWPARSRFEVIVGAILVQNTSWSNVTQAIASLRRTRVLSPSAIRNLSTRRLEQLLRPAGYFRQKSQTLKTFVAFLDRDFAGSLNRLFARPTAALRKQLLALRGIGPETADAILLYAGNHPVFVIDAYTRRILHRHGLAGPQERYDVLQSLFHTSLPGQAPLFNEFHALLVAAGKNYCRSRLPLCSQCPLSSFLPQPAGIPR